MNQIPGCILKLAQNMLALSASAFGCFVFAPGFSMVANGYGESVAISVRGNGAVPKLYAESRVTLFHLTSAIAKAMMIVQTYYR